MNNLLWFRFKTLTEQISVNFPSFRLQIKRCNLKDSSVQANILKTWMKSDTVTFPFYFTYNFSCTVQFFAANTFPHFGGFGNGTVRKSAANKQKHIDTCSVHFLLLFLFVFFFREVREFRYLYWVYLDCEQIPLQQKRWTMKKKKDKKHNRSNAHRTPISPVKCVWSSRFRSSSRTILSSYAMASLWSRLAPGLHRTRQKQLHCRPKYHCFRRNLNQICLPTRWKKNTEETTPQW